MAVSLIEEDEIQEGVYIYRYQNAEDGDVIVEKITAPAEYKKYQNSMSVCKFSEFNRIIKWRFGYKQTG